jgi:hypothetical protein
MLTRDVQRQDICEDENISNGYCNSTEIGEFILAENATDISKNLIFTQAIHLNELAPINYPIKKTGYFCVATYGFTGDDYSAIVTFRNAYGELPAAQIANAVLAV